MTIADEKFLRQQLSLKNFAFVVGATLEKQ
jgi:hypothetical protein